MKLKTNKLLTLTLASSLVAITAGCGGGTKAAAPTGTTTTPPPADTVAYSDWSGDATLVTVATENGFVAGTAASIDLTPALTGVESLNLASQVAPLNGTVSAITLGGAAVDGVAFASNGATTATELRYFAALHSGTDLGAPVPTTGAEAIWSNGLFQAVGADGTYATASKTFALTVTFGTTDATRTITALVSANTNADAFTAAGTSYYISGNYDAAGVITGNVLYGDFSATAADDAAARTVADGLLDTATADGALDPATVGLGVLSGLIGAQGAVGGFHSSGSDGDGATGFAGGFVVSALPNAGGEDSNAVYADWSGSDDVTIATALDDNGFLAGTAAGLTGAPSTGVVVVTLDLADETHPADPATDGAAGTVETNAGTDGTNARTLGGAATNGVAFFTNPGATAATTARYFAGLHLGTDLGAPVATTGTEATWNGLIQTVSGTTTSAFGPKVFELTVNFGTTDDDRTISAHVAAAADFTTESYYLSGTYDANGVITGTVSRGVIAADETADATENGTLSGLIGVTGAVGAFHSTGTAGDGATGYAGGFVAIPTAIADATVDTATAYAGNVVDYADLGVTPVNVLTANGFLAGTATGLTFTQPDPALVPVTVSLGTGLEGGVTFLETAEGAGAFYLAGIHNDVNLGSPISSTAEASGTWTGTFGAVGDATHTTTGTSITLTVAFGSTDAARTIVGLVPANDNANAHGTDGETSYYISATYTAAGVVTGNVLYRDFATGNANDGAARVAAAGLLTTATGGSATDPETVGLGTLTGLIGQSGAVGAFHSSGSDGNGVAGYAGGFAVTRTAPASP